MELLPPLHTQETLLQRLSDLIRQAGWERFVTAPLLEPDPQYFPDQWTPDKRGARRLAQRLLRYAGLKSLDVRMTVDPDGPDADEVHAAAWFTGIEKGICSFGLRQDQLQDDQAVTGSLCHEVAHAFRTHHDLVFPDHDREEEETDLTTIYLGFGILTLILTDRLVTGGRVDGAFATYQVRHSRHGYLSTQSLAFVLAVQLLVRGIDRKTRRRIEGCLGENQASCFRAAWKQFEDQRGMLCDRLGIPASSTWPPPIPLDHTPLNKPADEDVEEPDDHQALVQRGNEGRDVFRVRHGRGNIGFMLAIGGVMLATFFKDFSAEFVVAAGGLGALLGYAITSRWEYHECSDPGCQAVVPAGATLCPGCGGVLAGVIARAEDRLEAEENLQRRRSEERKASRNKVNAAGENEQQDGSSAALDENPPLTKWLPRTVFRLFRGHPALGVGIGTVVGLVAAVAWPVLFFVGPPIGWLVGRAIGTDVCSDPTCRRPLAPRAEECPGCKGIIAGRIRRANEHYTMAAEVRDELAAAMARDEANRAKKLPKTRPQKRPRASL